MSVVENAVTPYQLQLHRERQARQRRIAKAAVRDDGIDLRRHLRPPETEPEQEPDPVSEPAPEPVSVVEAAHTIEPPPPPAVINIPMLEGYPPPIRAIQWAAALYYNKTVTMLIGQYRSYSVVKARHVAMFISHKLVASSLPVIGRQFGGRDHTTVLYAIRKIEKSLPTTPELAADIAAILETLRALKFRVPDSIIPEISEAANA